VVQWMQEVTGIDLTQCPHCGARPLLRLPLAPLSPPGVSRGTPVEVPIYDSSWARGASHGCRSRYHNGFFRAPRGRASLWGSEAPTMWSPGPASTSRGGASGVLIPFSRLCVSCYHWLWLRSHSAPR